MPRFVADRMLGKLARTLRMLGHDVEWLRDGSREAVIERSAKRVLLTKDRALGQRVAGAFVVEPSYPFHQARQVIRAFALDDRAAFTRCVEDNGLLEALAPGSSAGEAPGSPPASGGPRYACPRCGRQYWAGTHVEHMRRTIMSLLEAPIPSDEHGTPDPDGAKLGRLEPLLDLHQAMDALFWGHRLALLRKETRAALGCLRRFAMAMARHIDLEEQLVLPAYEADPPAEGFPRGGHPDIFRRDHAKILAELEAIERACERIEREPTEEAQDLARLAVLDDGRRFVDLLSHHDHRERAFLYPRLAATLAPAEQTELLERMAELERAPT